MKTYAFDVMWSRRLAKAWRVFDVCLITLRFDGGTSMGFHVKGLNGRRVDYRNTHYRSRGIEINFWCVLSLLLSFLSSVASCKMGNNTWSYKFGPCSFSKMTFFTKNQKPLQLLERSLGISKLIFSQSVFFQYEQIFSGSSPSQSENQNLKFRLKMSILLIFPYLKLQLQVYSTFRGGIL